MVVDESNSTEKIDTNRSEIDKADEVRLNKISSIKSYGINPYSNKFKPSHLIDDVAFKLREWKKSLDQSDDIWQQERENFNNSNQNIEHSLSGRVMSRRDFGKGIFIDLQDSSGKMQILLGKNHLTSLKDSTDENEVDFDFLKKFLDVGDFIGVKGWLFWTQKGELTLQASNAFFLTKSLRQLPEKWHGLQDVETRYRQRYVDLIVNKDVRSVFIKRTKIINEIRAFFQRYNFMEVETPMLHPLVGGASARPFATYHNALSMPIYLRIAPELYLKRLVVGGFERVFEINRNFRNEGLSRKHNPEFTMLEFYWAYSTYNDLIPFTEDLISNIAYSVCGSFDLLYEDKPISFQRPWRSLTLKESLAVIGNFSDEVVNNPEEIKKILLKSQTHIIGNESLGKLQTLLFEEKVEPLLWDPTFITQFPIEVSPLARRNDDNPDVADRFELFIAGREIANAFSELNDSEDQKNRFLLQMESKNSGDEEAADYDADYIRALQYGLPPTAGEGIGIDRLVMILTNSPSIRDVILFPHMRPE